MWILYRSCRYYNDIARIWAPSRITINHWTQFWVLVKKKGCPSDSIKGKVKRLKFFWQIQWPFIKLNQTCNKLYIENYLTNFDEITIIFSNKLDLRSMDQLLRQLRTYSRLVLGGTIMTKRVPFSKSIKSTRFLCFSHFSPTFLLFCSFPLPFLSETSHPCHHVLE